MPWGSGMQSPQTCWVPLGDAQTLGNIFHDPPHPQLCVTAVPCGPARVLGTPRPASTPHRPSSHKSARRENPTIHLPGPVMNFLGSTVRLHSAAKNRNFCLFLFFPQDLHTPAGGRDAPGPPPVRAANIPSETTTCQRSLLSSTADSATSRPTRHLEQTMLLIRSAARAAPSPLAPFFGGHPVASPLPLRARSWPGHNLPHTQERSRKLCPIAMSPTRCHPLCALQSPRPAHPPDTPGCLHQQLCHEPRTLH